MVARYSNVGNRIKYVEDNVMPLTKAVMDMRPALPTYTASPRIKTASDIARKLNPNYSSPEPGETSNINFESMRSFPWNIRS